MTPDYVTTRPWLTVHEAAVLLHVSQKHVLHLCETGELSPTGVVRRERVIPITTLRAFLAGALDALD